MIAGLGAEEALQIRRYRHIVINLSDSYSSLVRNNMLYFARIFKKASVTKK